MKKTKGFRRFRSAFIVPVTVFLVGLPMIQVQGVPHISNMLSLLVLGFVPMFGFAHRKVPALCAQVSRKPFPKRSGPRLRGMPGTRG
jgi:hypothetical protein